MKKVIFLLLIFLAGLMSCNDFLELAPEYQINEKSFYKDANDYKTALIGIYAILQSVHNVNVLYINEHLTDNCITRGYGGEAGEALMTLTADYNRSQQAWTNFYDIIANSNNILDRIDGTEMESSVRDQIKGEVYFLRAYSYFYLVRLFGDLPIITSAFRSPDEIAAFDMTRKPVSEVYTLIEEDLKTSYELLQNSTETSKAKASAGAAQTLLGKVYLTKHQYADAESILKQVIENTGYNYDLMDDYGVLFTNNNDNLQESVFEIKYISGNVGEGNNFASEIGPALFNIALFPNNMNASGNLVPTQDMFDAYEEGDLRKAVSVSDSVPLTNGEWEIYVWGKKFVDFTVGVAGDGGINWTCLRYADVLLMYAEALNELNQTDNALTYINMVRDRADLDPLNGLTKEECVIALEKERRVEFLYEGHRWFDLIRTGRFKTVMNAYFAKIGFTYTVEDHKLLLPIPERETDIDDNLVQNPNY
jgi:tetratricopeptide (TPR) repeat protein